MSVSHMRIVRFWRIMSQVSHAEEIDQPFWPAVTAGASAPYEFDRALCEARAGDEHAFRTLYREMHPRLLRYVRGLVGEQAEDVTSEAWLHIARDIATFDGDAEAFRGWAATIARHRAFDYLRYRRRRPGNDAPSEEMLDLAAPDDTEKAAMDSLSTRAAVALVSRLPRDQAEIILLRIVIGLDVNTVASVVGKRPGAVRTAAHRGLRRLERLLAESDSWR